MRRRRLGAELRRLREAAGKSVDDVAELLECSRAKVSRIEGGRVGIRPLELQAMLGMYGANDEERDDLTSLARAGREPGWWQDYTDALPGRYITHFLGLESAATLVRAFEVSRIPGLLQTEDYTRAIHKGMEVLTDQEIERRIALRVARQSRLLSDDDPLEFRAVIDEGGLHRPLGGPAVMRAQLRHLLDLARRSNVRLQVVPFSQGGHAGVDGPFTILNFPGKPESTSDPGVVFIDYATGAVYLEKPSEIRQYNRIFDTLCSQALSPNQTIDLIAAIVAEYPVKEGTP